WLARRYDRPAIPDILVDTFQKPLEKTINQIANEHPSVFIAFNNVVYDVRVNLPASEQPPFDLQLIFLLAREELSSEEADAINIIGAAIQANLDRMIIHLNPEILIR